MIPLGPLTLKKPGCSRQVSVFLFEGGLIMFLKPGIAALPVYKSVLLGEYLDGQVKCRASLQQVVDTIII